MTSLRLIAPVVAAVGLHAALLLGAGSQAGGSAGPHADLAEPRGQALRVRWVAPALATPPGATAQAPEVPTAPTESAPAAPGGPARPMETASVLTPLDDAQPGAAVVAPARKATTTAPAPTEGEGPLAWLPRQALTQPPQALGPIVIDYPDGVRPATPVVRMKLALYIDERGHVRRTEPLGERLEAAFEHAANNAFLQATFAPGQLGPHAVRSRIVVEIDFEALPEQSAEPRGVRVAFTH